jgi:hypothetical protein
VYGPDVAVLSVQTQDQGGNPVDQADLQWWIDKHGLTYLVLGDPTMAAYNAYKLNGIPLNLVIDQQMVIRYKAAGFSEGAVINWIETLLDTDYDLAFEAAPPSGTGGSYVEGDLFYVNLQVTPPPDLSEADIYVLLEVGGGFWSYPGWAPLASGLAHLDYVPSGSGTVSLQLITPFELPSVPAGGPYHFYSAAFDNGYLDLDHLKSNVAALEFGFE